MRRRGTAWRARFHHGAARRVHISSSTQSLPPSRELFVKSLRRNTTMKDSTKDAAAGTFHEVKGAIKSQAGKLINDPDLEADGIVENVTGKIQKKIAQVEKVIEKP
jgi:uncharacterized protein YjbJ (UPF0337 family)